MAGASKKTVVAKICSDIDGLDTMVQKAFSSSPLAKDHDLILQNLVDTDLSAEILLADPGKARPFLDSISGLRWMQSTWAGVNALETIQRRDFTCTRLAGCLGPQMSEYVLGAVWSSDWISLKKLQDKERWESGPFRKRPRLNRMTLGCLGVGDIASVIANRGQAFGMRTLGYASRVREVPNFNEVTTDLNYLLANADIIVNVLPSTKETRGLLDGDVLKSCGENKLFINVGRGDVVSEEALLKALDQGWLSRAVLDVFIKEPLPAESPLWRHPSVLITPHIATISYPDDVAELFVENLALYLKGTPMRFVADLGKGY